MSGRCERMAVKERRKRRRSVAWLLVPALAVALALLWLDTLAPLLPVAGPPRE